MSLDTYDGLIAEVALLLNKTNLNAQIPSFIRLFEAQANRAIKHYRMQDRCTFDVEGDVASLPCGFLGVSTFKIDQHKVTYVTPDEMDDPRDAGGPWNGPPLYYSIVGDNLILSSGVMKGQAVLRYFKRIPSLSDTERCNWLLRDHPDVYLYGAALQAAPFLRDDDRIGVWNSFVQAAYEGINTESIESQMGAHAEVQIRSIA